MSPLSPLPHIPIDTKPTTAKSKSKPKPKIKSIDYSKQHYIQLCANEEGLWLEVMEIGWHGPHTPVSKWTPVLQIGVNPPQWVVSVQEIEQAINKVLKYRRYFRVCEHCLRLCAVGHMFDKSTCHGCATHVYGVVY